MPNFYLDDEEGEQDSPEDGISIDIIGESRPFSRYGQSICYHVNVLGYHYLVDCGAPIFEHIPHRHIEKINGLLATHSHEDHKRWFTDLALYMKYKAGDTERLNLITTEKIHEEFKKNSRGALERTLSPDSRKVVEVPYETFVNQVPFGPSPKYRIANTSDRKGSISWRVVDTNGEQVPPDKAKVVIKDQEEANRPRMLFRDPDTSLWVEPEQYYSFNSEVFYDQDRREIHHERGARSVTISPVKDPVWHGPPTIGIEFSTPDERVVFSSDTVYDPALWDELAHNNQEMNLPDHKTRDFSSSPIVVGDINQYIQRGWSKQRLKSALTYYEGAVVIHDCGPVGDPVHSDYRSIRELDCSQLILTHCPDRFISEFPIAVHGKTFHVKGDNVYEKNKEGTFPLQGDVYVRDSNSAYVGFKSDNGRYKVVKRDGALDIVETHKQVDGNILMKVALYRDINGQYFPYLASSNKRYKLHEDGQVEEITRHEGGSSGVFVESVRGQNGRIRSDSR